MTHLKVINASWGSIHTHENLKRKLYKCNANIYFNQQCLKKQLIPTYAKIKVPNTSPAHKYTERKIPNLRIKDEIEYLHKKQKLNQDIYHLHIPGQHLEQNLAIHPTHSWGKTPEWSTNQIQDVGQKTEKTDLSTNYTKREKHIPP